MTTVQAEVATEIPAGNRAHPQHKLKWVKDSGNAKFTCTVCRETGSCADGRYRCGIDMPCDNLELHNDCALAEDTMVHQLFKEDTFKLCRQAPTVGMLCNACGAKVEGWHYRCTMNDFICLTKNTHVLHPCCAKLPMQIKAEDLTLELHKEGKHKCDACRGPGGYMTFWYYSSTSENINLHVSCVKESLVRSSNGSGGSSSTRGDNNVMTTFVRDKVLIDYKGDKSSEKLLRICKVVAFIIRIIIGLTIGDPTALIIGLITASTS